MGNGENTIEALAKLDTEFRLYIRVVTSNVIAHEVLSHIMSPFVQSNQAIIYMKHRYS